MTKVTIDRELLERATQGIEAVAAHFGSYQNEVVKELRAILAAPRQPEGEAISRERVQAEADAFFDWPTTDKSSVTTTSCLIFARCIAGMVAAERDATIAELREEISDLHRKLDKFYSQSHGIPALAEIERLRQQVCDLRNDLCTEAEDNDRLRQQRDRRDAEIMEQCRLNGMGAERELKLLTQRDKLAGLMAKAQEELDPHRHAVLWGEICAALAEVK